jgi:hypothetical protein
MATAKSTRRRTRARPQTRGRKSAPSQPRVAARRSRAQPSLDAMAERLAEIDGSIDALRRTVARLKAMPADGVAALPLVERQARARTLSNANLAIEDLENAKLAVLNDAFEARRPELALATSQLAGALAQLQDVVAFIGAAAAAVGIIADVASVLA